MLDDQQLLRRYAADGSEAAFGDLVARYVNLVYSAALRRTGGDAHLAQDVAQLVFTDLARKARSLPEGVVLTGWLHRATQYAAAQLLRTERRRAAREQEALAMNILETEPASDWEQIRPLLDQALDELGRDDRDALLLRFFEQRSLAEVGNALGSNEDAARKRVSRALDKLRADLVRRGVTTTAAALSTVISASAVQVAPAGLAATLTSTSLASAAVGTGTTLTALKLMAMTKLKVGIISAIVVASVATPLVIQHQAQVKLREENASLRQQLDQQAQLMAENDRLANRVAQTTPQNDQLSELLRLRGEVGLLRQQTNDLGRLREDNQLLHTRLANTQNQSVQLTKEDQFRLHRKDTINAMQQLLVTMKIYAEDNNGQYATNFDQMRPNFTGNLTLGDFEFVSSTNVTPFKIIFRERNACQTPDGKWERVYGLSDFTVVTPQLEDGNFDAYERQVMVSP